MHLSVNRCLHCSVVAAYTLASMSRAFIKESDQDPGVLPERAISPHPNLVTARGLAALAARVHELEERRRAARAANDTATLAGIARELHYFQARRATARLVTPPAVPEAVRFGVLVRLARADGSAFAYRIVGEDEADPAAGLISYVSPLAEALLGLGVGDEVDAAGARAEIVALES
jgi:transcription elongation GreA/GreB family factor